MDDIILTVALASAGVLLIFLFWRRGALQGSGLEPEETELPPAAVVDRLFSPEDLQYAQTLAKPIRKLFLKDRSALAMTWVRQIRYTGILLMQRHARAVRQSPQLHPWTELRVAVSFLTILVGCEVFALSIAIFGPVRVRGLVAALAGRMHALQSDLSGSYLPEVYQAS